MQQPGPTEPLEDDAHAIERRFAELMRRFWRGHRRPEPTDEGNTT